MSTFKRQARVAGVLYLLMSVTSAFSLATLPSWSLSARDPSTIIEKLTSGSLQYRMGVVSDLAAQVLFVFLVLALFELLKTIHRRRALLMVALVLVQVPMGFANLLLGIIPLVLQSGAAYLSVFDQAQLDALTMVAVSLRGHGVKAVMVYWGLWLLPFGLLVFRSGFIPRVFGVLLIVGCFGHLAVGVTSLLFPAYERTISPLTALALGEILICLWLVIKGARDEVAIQQPS
jgi:Domain of unknown function (DUF4386)